MSKKVYIATVDPEYALKSSEPFAADTIEQACDHVLANVDAQIELYGDEGDFGSPGVAASDDNGVPLKRALGAIIEKQVALPYRGIDCNEDDVFSIVEQEIA